MSGTPPTHWADEKEVVSSNLPLLVLLKLLRHVPAAFAYLLAFPVSLFYFARSQNAREHATAYQRRLRAYTGSAPQKIRPWRQVLSFSICVVEKFAGWLGKYDYRSLIKHDDDLKDILRGLDQGQGAVIIFSHLGNMELLRSIAMLDTPGSARSVGVTAIMETANSQQFMRTLEQINPGVQTQVLAARDIGPDTIELLQERIAHGGLVCIAGDRTSAHSRQRVLTKNFLGCPAQFPYGSFMLAFLLKAPVYYMFGLRTRTATLHPRNNIIVEKSAVNVSDCPRSERPARMDALCGEFVQKLEKYCAQYPYQWYNFFDFWQQGTGG